MRTRTVLFVLLTCALATTAAQTPIDPEGLKSFPVSAQLIPGDGKVKVVVRNTVTEAAREGIAMPLEAVVLRGVQWAGVTPPTQIWLAPLGGTTKRLPDGSVEHNTITRPMTALAFERGLLLPGERFELELPPPPAGAEAELVITYAYVAPPDRDYTPELLLPEYISPKGPGKPVIKYSKVTPELLDARYKSGGYALVKRTMKRGAKPLPTREARLKFKLPAATTP